VVNEAYKRYKDKSPAWHPNGQSASEFRQQNTWGNEKIRFLGVFDTVGALGAPFGIILGWIVDKLFQCSFHNTQLSSIVQSAYHALAIDERRLPFLPTLMDPNTAQHNPSNFEQRWFPGVHSNVGGGYPHTGLSDLALEWMAEKATQHGLKLDLKRISHPPVRPDMQETPQNSQTMGYRIASVLFVKLPACVGLVPKKYKDASPHIQWNGDYLRPIPDQGSLHVSVINKIKQSGAQYQPPNVSW
jgi:hypothetical protein